MSGASGFEFDMHVTVRQAVPLPVGRSMAEWNHEIELIDERTFELTIPNMSEINGEFAFNLLAFQGGEVTNVIIRMPDGSKITLKGLYNIEDNQPMITVFEPVPDEIRDRLLEAYPRRY